MALAELAEKGPDADLLREMIQYVAQRMMEMDVEGRARPPTAPVARIGRTAATATVTGSGTPAPGVSILRSRSFARGATSRGSSSRVGPPRRPSPR